jgi:alpha-beta hydrolase superfamily lysophospholipase
MEMVTYDHRGHGLSTGRRGDAPSFEAFLEDLKQVIQFAGGTPFLYGHSFGGLVTIRFLQERIAAVRGAVVASPLLRLVFEPPRWKLVLAAFARSVWPTLTQNSGVNPEVLSRDMAFLAESKKQELSHRRISARLFYEFNRNAELAMAEGERITQPLLLLHGQKDRLTSWEATKALFPRVASADKALRLYPETYHEAHNDLNREEILQDVVEWVEARL